MAASVRKSLAVFGVQLTSEALSLVRSILLARLLGPAEMGVCAILALTLSLLDMLSDLGPDRLLIQAEDGDQPEFQKTAQSLQALRGLACACALLVFAIPVASLLGTPAAYGQLAAVGLITLLRGGLHLDVKRRQRTGNFRPQLTADLVSAIAATLTVVLLAPWLRNAWLFVAAGTLQSLVLVLMSHLTAERRYSWGYNRDVARRMLIFGWPLVLNGLLMFGAMQGDRLIVLGSASKADLGRYAVAIQFSLIPVLLLSRVASTLWLPLLARDQSQPVRFQARLNQLALLLGAVALTFSLGFMSLGGPVLRLLYGPEFSVSTGLLGWLAVMQGVRLLRSLPSLAAMARADSLNPLAANVLRLAGLIAALAACLMGLELEAIAAAGAVGEFLALAGSIVLLHRRHGIATGRLWETAGVYTVGMILGGAAMAWTTQLPPAGLLAGALALTCLLWLTMRASRPAGSPFVAATLAPVPNKTTTFSTGS